jgi:FMN phosphatase YigB (HAD superfamily)
MPSDRLRATLGRARLANREDLKMGRNRRQRRRRVAAVGGAAIAAKHHHDKKEAEQQQAAEYDQPVDAGNDQPAQGSAGGMTPETMDELKQLGELHEQGVLTDEEFASQKAKLLGPA